MSVEPACRVATSAEELGAAREVVRRMYEAQGYDVASGSITAYLGDTGATTFGLFMGDTLYGTISIVRDGSRGLPMDSMYRDELAPWRTEGKVLAEVVQFAIDHARCKEATGRVPGPFAATPLFSVVLACALAEHIDYLCISINPKHDRFYSLLGFKQIGALKQYGAVNAPAIARALYVPEWQAQPLIRSFLGKETMRRVTLDT